MRKVGGKVFLEGLTAGHHLSALQPQQEDVRGRSWEGRVGGGSVKEEEGGGEREREGEGEGEVGVGVGVGCGRRSVVGGDARDEGGNGGALCGVPVIGGYRQSSRKTA